MPHHQGPAGLKALSCSPWTPVPPIVECFGTGQTAGCELEVHSHPTGVMYTYSEGEVRDELQKRSDEAGDAPHTLALADVEEAAGRGERLIRWAQIAQEVANS